MLFLSILLVAQGIFSFGFDLSKPLQTKNQNTVFSPLSVSTTLAMCAIGAKDKTYDEMIKSLHFKGSQEALSREFQTILKDLKAKEDVFPNLSIELATALWMQKDFQFLPVYQSEVINDFFGHLRPIDFTKPGSAVFEMNQWFFEKVGGFSGPLFTTRDITEATRLVALSTLHLKSYFEKPFESTHTRTKVFHVTQDKTVPIEIMYQKNTFPYFKGNEFAAISMNYLPLNKEYALFIILPDTFDQFTFTESVFQKIITEMSPQMIELELPRFRVESSLDLIPALKTLGIEQAFTQNANFSLMTEGNDLMISDFRHKALIIVDEGGTTAEAATSATFILKMLPPSNNPIKFSADRPFFFLILDKKNNIPLFMGQVVEPKVLELNPLLIPEI